MSLGFELDVGLQCENGMCTGVAVYVVRIHPADYCNRPGLDVDRNRVYMFCPACTASVGLRISGIIDKGAFFCHTCGKRIEKLHDIYEMESLVSR